MNSTKFAWIVLLVSIIIMVWLKQRSLYASEDEFHVWIINNELLDIKDIMKNSGFHSTDSLSMTSLHLLSKTLRLNNEQFLRLKTAHDHLVLHKWLIEINLNQFEAQLLQHHITSLESVINNREFIEKNIDWKGYHKMFVMAVEQLKSRDKVKSTSGLMFVLLILGVIFIALIAIYFCVTNVLESIAVMLIDVIVYIFMTVLWFIIAGIIGRLVGAITGRRITYPNPPSFTSFRSSSNNSNSFSFLRNSRQPVIRHERSGSFHLGLYDRFTGRNVDNRQCTVEWNTEDLTEVGKSTVATVHFHCRNGLNYKLQPSDNVLVKVSHLSSHTTLLHAIEPASLSGEETIKISFTPKLIGEYSVCVSLNGSPIGRDREAISRHYKPASVDPSKTVFLQESNTIVVTAGLYHSMQVIPKDRFGNAANICQDFLTAEIRKGCSTGDEINPECVIDNPVTNQYEILLKVEEVGYFVGCVKYEGDTIGPSSINIISLSESDSVTVDRNVAKRCNVYYEAQLVTSSGNKQKRVYCYPSPRQIQVKEFLLLGIIPKRIYTCKVCPSTRIIFHESQEMFTFDDGYQSPLVLTSIHREVLAATFYKFLLKNIGGSEKFQDKQKFFYSEVKKLRSYHTRGETSLNISRHNLLENAIQATRSLNSSEWYKKFSIEFHGEEGLDWGGVSREFFELVCVRCFDPIYHLFMRFTDNPQDLVHPNPNRPVNLKLKHFEFAGRVVGKCLYESALGNPLMVKARFSRSFLAQIIGLRINHKYFESDNPELFTTKIQYIRDNDVTDLGLVFAEEEFDTNGMNTIVPLISKGDEIEVTNQNKMQYLNLLAQYKLSKCVKDEVDHFLKGLNELIPDHLLSIFDETELELLMCGVGTVSFNELKIHTVVNGSNITFRQVVSWFWTLVSGFTQEEMAKLLQFVSGCSQLPPGGFKDLHPPFTIISAPTHGRLPTAHTCFNQLCLPHYDSYDQFQQALTMSLNEGSEGFGFA